MKITESNLIKTLLHEVNGWKIVDEANHLEKDNINISIDTSKTISVMDDNNLYISIDFCGESSVSINHYDFENEILPFLKRNIDIKEIPDEKIEEWFIKQDFNNIELFKFNHDFYELFDDKNKKMLIMLNTKIFDINKIKNLIIEIIEIYES